MAQHQRRPERRQGRPPGRREATRGAERSEHRSALDEERRAELSGGAGGRPRRLGLSLPHAGDLVDVERLNNEGQGETAREEAGRRGGEPPETIPRVAVSQLRVRAGYSGRPGWFWP